MPNRTLICHLPDVRHCMIDIDGCKLLWAARLVDLCLHELLHFTLDDVDGFEEKGAAMRGSRLAPRLEGICGRIARRKRA